MHKQSLGVEMHGHNALLSPCRAAGQLSSYRVVLGSTAHTAAVSSEQQQTYVPPPPPQADSQSCTTLHQCHLRDMQPLGYCLSMLSACRGAAQLLPFTSTSWPCCQSWRQRGWSWTCWWRTPTQKQQVIFGWRSLQQLGQHPRCILACFQERPRAGSQQLGQGVRG